MWVGWAFVWLLFFPAAGSTGISATIAEPAAAEPFQNTSSLAVQAKPLEPSGPDHPGSAAADPKKEKDRKRLKFLLAVNLVFIIVIFTFFLILSLIRFSRFQRQRLQIGKKAEPTAYVDAWSQYRLDEKDIEPGPLGDSRETDTDDGK